MVKIKKKKKVRIYHFSTLKAVLCSFGIFARDTVNKYSNSKHRITRTNLYNLRKIKPIWPKSLDPLLVTLIQIGPRQTRTISC